MQFQAEIKIEGQKKRQDISYIMEAPVKQKYCLMTSIFNFSRSFVMN